MVSNIPIHRLNCRPRIQKKNENRVPVNFWQLDSKIENKSCLNLGSPVLKPFPLYKELMLKEIFHRNTNKRYREEWRLKDAMVHNSERRLGDGMNCKVCTMSKFNGKAGDDEWMTYNHCHYSTLLEPVEILIDKPEGCWYRCVPCMKTHMI